MLMTSELISEFVKWIVDNYIIKTIKSLKIPLDLSIEKCL